MKKSINKMWQDVQMMSIKKRAKKIKYIVGLNRYTSSFIDYEAKYFLACLIHNSECYYNESGTIKKVPEFDNLGWYTGRKLDFNKIMN